MLDFIFRTGLFVVSKVWIFGLAILILTVSLGTAGFLRTTWDDGTHLSFLDSLYSAVSLLAIETGAVAASDNLSLEAARWLGMLFWASALLTLIVQLFREPVYRMLVRIFARNHVVVAGLGEQGPLLVSNLRRRGRTVVILEPDRNHPALEECRRVGAITIFGDPDNPDELDAASVRRAAAVLAIFREEDDCVRTATAVHQLVLGDRSSAARLQSPPVRCVLRLTEPGLLDVVRSHGIKFDHADRFKLEVLNSHEIAAATMVREAWATTAVETLRRAILLGLGTRHRLGEMIVVRAVKDYLIAHDGRSHGRLEFHVFDRQAEEWIAAFRSRYPGLDSVCSLIPHRCWARKVGPLEFSEAGDFDAAYVCIADEGQATAQAVMLRRKVLTRGQPIMVRVKTSLSGFGRLIDDPHSGWGVNIQAVGMDDSLIDPDFATQPEVEMRAQAIHQSYRTRNRGLSGPENKPWRELDSVYRDSNRRLADRYSALLKYADGHSKRRCYRLAFDPDGLTRALETEHFLFRFEDDEVEALAAREHQLWKNDRELAGWKFGPTKDPANKTHPWLVDYDKLSDETARELNRQFIRGIPAILALSDETIVEDRIAPATGDSP